ncbi:MAG: sugar ABC transporter ATP-binding protein, partial [Fimbriimonadaceae bacterium]
EPHRLGLLQRNVMHTRAKDALTRLKSDISPATMVGELPLASKQLVEIAKALAQNAKILILDEPTAVLAERETRDLLDLLKSLKDEGVGVIYVSHRLDEVCEIADHVTVLRDGVVVAEIPREQGLSSSDLANRMVGRELQDLYPPKLTDHSGNPVLTLNQARFEGFPGAIDLEVKEGEIVGLGGLIGSGRTEVAQGIIRKRKLLGGQVTADAPAYVSEDRKGTGLHLSLNLTTNTVMANLKHYGGLTLDKGREKQAANVWIKKLGIRAKNPEVMVQSLSGGNQQKVSLAKWLETQPKLLVLDEPTRGVDVGAKSEIYQLINEMAKSGLGCLVISSEMNELIGLCDRVIVMRERKIAGELEGDQVTESNMMALAAGVEVEAVS